VGLGKIVGLPVGVPVVTLVGEEVGLTVSSIYDGQNSVSFSTLLHTQLAFDANIKALTWSATAPPPNSVPLAAVQYSNGSLPTSAMPSPPRPGMIQ